MNEPKPSEVARLKDLISRGDDASALAFASRLAQRYLGSTLALNAWGALLGKSGNHGESLKVMERVARLAPGDPMVLTNLANNLAFVGRMSDAEAVFRKAISLRPNHAEARFGLGTILSAQDRLEEAETCFRSAIAIDPGHIRSLTALGGVLTVMGKLAAAQDAVNAALRLAPDNADAIQQLALIRFTIGEIDAAMELFRVNLAKRPQDLSFHSNALLAMQYLPSADPRNELERAVDFGRVSDSVARPFSRWGCAVPPEVLRVGVVSGDLRSHPVGYFLEGVCANLDRRRIVLTAFSSSHIEDDTSARLRRYFADWISIASLADEEAARRIHGKSLHVLVDLAGHTALNRLALFAWRPAPVQVSWLGYVGTTGLGAIDYLLADPVTLPVSQEPWYVEKIRRLPDTRFCFTAPADALPVAPLPALARGHVTFACFNNLSKLNDRVLALWHRVLAACPGSELKLMARQLSDPTVQHQMMDRLARLGFDPSRVGLSGSVPRTEYLRAYHGVDIALDPFPFTGGTTTAEALWMGVPVITLEGTRLVERQGVGLLSAAGLQEWIAKDEDAYVELAFRAASDLNRLAMLREGLRQKVEASPAFDGRIFAEHLTDALWAMWNESDIANGLQRLAD